jgi:hypothetical protein
LDKLLKLMLIVANEKQVLFITITLLKKEDRTIKSYEPSKQEAPVQDIQIQDQDVELSCSLVVTLQERD